MRRLVLSWRMLWPLLDFTLTQGEPEEANTTADFETELSFYFLAEHVFAKFATHLNFCLFFDFLDSSWFPCNTEKKS